MKNRHLNEQEIQEYVLCKVDCDNTIFEHINHCHKCRVEADLYKLLFAAVGEEQEPNFDFDIENSVMQKLHEKQNLSYDKYIIRILAGSSIIALSVLFYLIAENFPTVFVGFSTIKFSLIIVTTVLISIFLFIDLKKDYQSKINFS